MFSNLLSASGYIWAQALPAAQNIFGPSHR